MRHEIPRDDHAPSMWIERALVALDERDDRMDERIGGLDEEKADRRELEPIRASVVDLRDDFKGVQRALWAFAIGLPIGGILLVIAVVNLVHK